MDSRLAILLAGLVVGTVAGGLAVAATQSPHSGVSVPSSSTTAVIGCLSGDEPPAWVGQTGAGAGEYRAVLFQNYSFTHENPDIGVRGDLTDRGDGRWELALTTVVETPTKEADDDCRPRTTVSASVALPAGFETLTVTLDGDPIATVAHSGNRPAFRYLNGTGSA